MRALMDLADDWPLLWLQLHEDWLAAAEAARSQEGPSWRKPGEKAVDARDRLRAERMEAKRRAGSRKLVHD